MKKWFKQALSPVALTATFLILTVTECRAQTFVAAGDQSLCIVDKHATSVVQTASFVVTRVGASWSVMTTYTNNPGAIHYLSFPQDGQAEHLML